MFLMIIDVTRGGRTMVLLMNFYSLSSLFLSFVTLSSKISQFVNASVVRTLSLFILKMRFRLSSSTFGHG